MTPRTRSVTVATLEDAVLTLHERGAVNAIALNAVLKDLLDGKPLTLDGLAAIFGVDVLSHLETQFKERGS